MQNEKKVVLNFSYEEINTLLKALGNLPFNEVYELIGRIHEQANAQADEVKNKAVK
jgi:hypothetical protein